MKTFVVFKIMMIALILATTGCEEATFDPSFTLGKASTFRIGQIYHSNDGIYTLQINELSDSRCPEGVVCVWAGEVIIKGDWTAGNKSTFELHSVMVEQQVQPAGYTIQIIDVKPYPKIGVTVPKEEMVITLLVQKN